MALSEKKNSARRKDRNYGSPHKSAFEYQRAVDEHLDRLIEF